jgi:hypothetical protein
LLIVHGSDWVGVPYVLDGRVDEFVNEGRDYALIEFVPKLYLVADLGGNGQRWGESYISVCRAIRRHTKRSLLIRGITDANPTYPTD